MQDSLTTSGRLDGLKGLKGFCGKGNWFASFTPNLKEISQWCRHRSEMRHKAGIVIDETQKALQLHTGGCRTSFGQSIDLVLDDPDFPPPMLKPRYCTVFLSVHHKSSASQSHEDSM